MTPNATPIMPAIEHIVLLMLENRSLDNLLGWLYPAGATPSRCIPSTFNKFDGLVETRDFNEYKGTRVSVAQGTQDYRQPCRVPGFDPHEPYHYVNQQLFGDGNSGTYEPPPSPTPALMKGFAYDYDARYESWAQLREVMGAYSPSQLPILNGLARAYAVSDRWFSSVPTQTNPNRAFSICGTSLGREKNQSITAVEQFDTATIWNKLPEDVTWGLFYQDCWHDGKSYTQYTFPWIDKAPHKGQIARIDEFYALARAGKLPMFTYLEPKWGYGMGKVDGSGFYCEEILGHFIGAQGNDYHPPTWVGPGEAFVNKVYESLIANRSAWEKTLLIITFDEHGGTYDHVGPPWHARKPDGHTGETGFEFNRFGVRVPTILASPRIPESTVFRAVKPGTNSESETPYDHTSLIATILRWKGVDPTKAGLGARVAAAPTFEGVLSSDPRTDVPRFTVPSEYAEQGANCVHDTCAEGASIGLVKQIVDECADLAEIEKRLSEL